jgi:putative inorganic carbon (HCO3(-)) transporter
MRDILVVLMLFFPLCYGLAHPWVGVSVWTLVSLMNPHRFAWGFAYNLSFAAAAAFVTFVGLVFSKDPKRPPTSGPAITMMLLSLWLCITTMAAFFPESSSFKLSEVLKVNLMTVIAMCVIVTEKHIKVMMWIMTLSIGAIAAKGGLFTLLTGGSYRVWGPPSSVIEDNNAFAVAAVMVVPMLAFLVTQVENKWMKWGLILSIPLSVLASLGSQSRGALVAICAMLLFFVLKSKRKFLIFFLLLAALPFVLSFLPQEWYSRMSTISTYSADSSAMGRLNAWHMAWNLAQDRLTGGGFAIQNAFVYGIYRPGANQFLTAHSIYFQMMGEHGFIGLILFLALWVQTWMMASWIARNARKTPGLEWMENLARMLQVSQIGYLVGGAFLSLAYWDMPYYQMVLIVAMRRLLKERATSASRDEKVVARQRRMETFAGVQS